GIAKLEQAADERRSADEPIDQEGPAPAEESHLLGLSTVSVGRSVSVCVSRAQLTLRATASNVTLFGNELGGSPHYMAPEQWLNSAEADARTDQYALAVLAYECLTGVRPFEGRSLKQIAHAHASKAIPTLGADFPRELNAVLWKGMARDVAERYPT